MTMLSKLVPAAACTFGTAGTARAAVPMIMMTTSKIALKVRILPRGGTLPRRVCGADLAILFLCSFSTFLPDLDRDLYGQSRTVCSLCRTRTRLFVLSVFLRKDHYTAD